MDVLFTVLPVLLYPVLVAIGAFRASRQVLSLVPESGIAYLQKGCLWLLLPPLVLVIVMASPWLLEYKGVCFGWLDSPDRPCSVWEFFQIQLFWALMLGTVPILLGWGVSILVFAGTWFFHHRNRA